MQLLDTPIIQKSYELYRLLSELQYAIAKAQRYTLWQTCQLRCLELVEAFIETAHSPPAERLKVLSKASRIVDLLRILLRLAFDTRTIDRKIYLALQMVLDDIGRMLGGWLKSYKQ